MTKPILTRAIAANLCNCGSDGCLESKAQNTIQQAVELLRRHTENKSGFCVIDQDLNGYCEEHQSWPPCVHKETRSFLSSYDGKDGE